MHGPALCIASRPATYLGESSEDTLARAHSPVVFFSNCEQRVYDDDAEEAARRGDKSTGNANEYTQPRCLRTFAIARICLILFAILSLLSLSKVAHAICVESDTCRWLNAKSGVCTAFHAFPLPHRGNGFCKVKKSQITNYRLRGFSENCTFC